MKKYLPIFITCLMLFIINNSIMAIAIQKNNTIDNSIKTGNFDFKKQLFSKPSSISLCIDRIDMKTGKVIINGTDTKQPSTPFTWNWGDGRTTKGWFPQKHTYSDLTRNYIIEVTSHYSKNKTDFEEIIIRFVSPDIQLISLPPDLSIIIPKYRVTLNSRIPKYRIPNSLTYFDDSYFKIIPRKIVEYVLTVAAHIQKDFINDDVCPVNNSFIQYVLRDPKFNGGYSLWYSNPICLVVGDYGFLNENNWSTLFHEMGHNFSLNTPSKYYFGGKIDGNANAILSESLAQIFQHATAYELLNNYSYYRLSDDLYIEIKQSTIETMNIVVNSYRRYINSRMEFNSWNDSSTPEDETFDTFMTIAYKFFEHAENSDLGYKIPLKKMMALLQIFNEDMKNKYNQSCNTKEAESFRATFMVAALSHAFSKDLRKEFKNLNFPINDKEFDILLDISNKSIP